MVLGCVGLFAELVLVSCVQRVVCVVVLDDGDCGFVWNGLFVVSIVCLSCRFWCVV